MRHYGNWVQSSVALLVLGLAACSGEGDNVLGSAGGAGNAAAGQGGQPLGQGGAVTAAGGSSANATGSTTSVGGTTASGSTSSGSTSSVGGATLATGGKSSTGGAMSVGGVSTGGATTATGGKASTGGAISVGGASTGGATAATGGKASTGGATSVGGASTGGTSTGGTTATGGKASTGGTTATGGKASTGGTTSAGGASACDASWNPPATANGNTGLPAGLAKEWARTGPATLLSTNTKIHQMMDNGGKMRYCARWDSSSPISFQQRQQAAELMRKCDNQWTDKLTGWGCWPYSTIDVKIVMWVVRDASLLTGWTAAEGSYVIGKVTSDEATDMACPSSCYQLPGQTQKTSCTGGQVFDEFLWLDGDKTDYTGWGWSDGFYMSASHFMAAATSNASTETIVAHELGHGHSLNDFYNASEVPAGWTHFVMMAGSSTVVTETDGWMLRDVWRHIRKNWGFPAAQ